MPVVDLPIITYFDTARFKQFNPTDAVNWTLNQSELGKKKVAMYPEMGRRHVRYLNENKLVFGAEPRNEVKTINYSYYVVANSIIRVDNNFNETVITIPVELTTQAGDIFFDFIVNGSIVYACFADGQHLYIYREDTQEFGIATTTHINPLYIKVFGSRLLLGSPTSAAFFLSQILLGDPTQPFNTFLANVMVNTGSVPNVFAQEVDLIRQFAVKDNTLYIFTAFSIGIWSDTPSAVTDDTGTTTTFPFKKNSSAQCNVGLADNAANTVDTSFDYIAWLGQYKNGLVQPMRMKGNTPEVMQGEAMDVLLQRLTNRQKLSPNNTIIYDGFLYEYENRIFYRLSGGLFDPTGFLDKITDSFSTQFNFRLEKWSRCAELNGGRSRIRKHLYFANRHLVTVLGDGTVYDMAGQYYVNERRNPAQANAQAIDAYIVEPFRQEAVTPLINVDHFEPDDVTNSEFETQYVEIDFVFGESFINYSDEPFENTTFIIAENEGADSKPIYIIAENSVEGEPVFIITEDGNFPTTESPTYNTLFKPHIELYWSDDGGITFASADVREFSVQGQYQWRMRWYELGTSRNRCYKLVCVSPVPIVVLGGWMSGHRISGGAD